MSDTKKNVVFLDIDGPVINTPCYSIDKSCSLKRTVMNQSAIGWVNNLCRTAKAWLVTNSTHSWYDIEGRTLKDDLIRFGMDEALFHNDWRTAYPDKLSGGSRLACIGDWIGDHPGIDNWIAFDDVNFTDSKRLIVVDFDDGITYRHFSKALKHFGIRQKIF